MGFIFMPQMSRAFGDGVVVQVRIEQVSLTFTAEHSPAHAPLCRERQFCYRLLEGRARDG